MVKFVKVDALDGRAYHINPERIDYITARREGGSNIVFEAMAGGVHQLGVGTDPAETAAAIEGQSRRGIDPAPIFWAIREASAPALSDQVAEPLAALGERGRAFIGSAPPDPPQKKSRRRAKA